MTLYDSLAATSEGRRGLASARLRQAFRLLIHTAQAACGLSQTQIASMLGHRRSAVNQVFNGSGNLRVNTIADYLDAMNFEAEVILRPAGFARRKIAQRAEMQGGHSVCSASYESAGFVVFDVNRRFERPRDASNNPYAQERFVLNGAGR